MHDTLRKRVGIGWLICACAMWHIEDVCAQRRTKNSLFKAGAMFGLNNAQADGDFQVGYDYRSMMGGLRGSVILHRAFEVCTELLYTRRGARPEKGVLYSTDARIFLEADYAEVPLLLKLIYPRTENRAFGFDLYAGASYGRLVRSETRPLVSGTRLDTFNLGRINRTGLRSSDISLIFGGGLYVTRRGGLFLRHTVSLTPYYRDNNPPPVRSTGPGNVALPRIYPFFRYYYWSVGAFYDVVSPKPAKKKTNSRPRPLPRS